MESLEPGYIIGRIWIYKWDIQFGGKEEEDVDSETTSWAWKPKNAGRPFRNQGCPRGTAHLKCAPQESRETRSVLGWDLGEYICGGWGQGYLVLVHGEGVRLARVNVDVGKMLGVKQQNGVVSVSACLCFLAFLLLSSCKDLRGLQGPDWSYHVPSVGESSTVGTQSYISHLFLGVFFFNFVAQTNYYLLQTS